MKTNRGMAACMALALGLLALSTSLAAQPPAAKAWRRESVERDVAYGRSPEQRLDVFTPAGVNGSRAVVMFVHGGGFEVGDKADYENIMLWLNRNGLVGINLNYRLYPRATYPAQEQDVAAAVRWARANVARFGGDPGRIVVWGHSSGGSVVGNYVGTPALQGPGGAGVRGAILLSAPLDLVSYGRRFGYFGADRNTYPARSPQTALLRAEAPILLGAADGDLPNLPAQQEAASKLLCAAGKCPAVVTARGDHMSEVFDIGGGGDATLSRAVLTFVRQVAG